MVMLFFSVFSSWTLTQIPERTIDVRPRVEGYPQIRSRSIRWWLLLRGSEVTRFGQMSCRASQPMKAGWRGSRFQALLPRVQLSFVLHSTTVECGTKLEQ